MARRYFVSQESSKMDGWMMCGCSFNGKNYTVQTNYLKADEVPVVCGDAKDFSELAAGLLNAFFNKVDVSKMTPEQVMRLGVVETEVGVPHPGNPELLF